MEARLSSQIDIVGFRAEARNLLTRQVPPEQVNWRADPGEDGPHLAEVLGAQAHGNTVRAAAAIVPPSFLRLCELVVLHRDPERFALLYRLLWRLVHEPGLRGDPVDDDLVQAQHMAQAVRRDIYKMKTGLRFRALPPDASGRPRQMAWFEPAHHVVETVAPWYAKRTPEADWVVLTPERSAEWKAQELRYCHGMPRTALPPTEAREAAWLAAWHGVFPCDHSPAQ